MDHIPSILICNSMYSLLGNHKLDKVSDFVIKFLNYLRKYLLKNDIIQSNEQQSKLFGKKRFKIKRLQINQQHDEWSCGFHSLLARQNFLNLLLQCSIILSNSHRAIFTPLSLVPLYKGKKRFSLTYCSILYGIFIYSSSV